MRTRIVALLLIAIIVSILVGLFLVKNPSSLRSKSGNLPSQDNKILVSTSFYPLADFAQKIGGDKVRVINLTPAGSEPHDYEPTPKDLSDLYNSKLFIYNGAGLEGWVDKVLPDLLDRKIGIVKASDNIEVYGTTTKIDPHIWLDPVFAQQMAINIRNGLQKVDPVNADFYNTNADKLIVDLVSLDTSYQRSLQNCLQTDVVTSHEAMGYLSRRYKFLNFSISGLSPNEEPSPQKMADLATLVKEKQVKYILTETLVSTKLADTLASEAKVGVLVFNPLEGLTPDQLKSGEDYFSIQKNNIKNLSQALECTIN